MPKTTKANTFDAKAIAAELFACIGGLKAKLETIAKGIRSQDELDAVWVEFCKLAKGYKPGTLKVYKAMVKGFTRIPKANKGGKGRPAKGGKGKGEDAEDEETSPDESTPKSTLAAWAAIIPALKRHGFKLAELVATLENLYGKA